MKENSCARVSFEQIRRLSVCNFAWKDFPAQVLSFEICEFFKDTIL